MPEKPTIDPKSIVLFPLWTFVILSVASIFFDVPPLVIFLVLALVLVYFIVIVVIELLNS